MVCQGISLTLYNDNDGKDYMPIGFWIWKQVSPRLDARLFRTAFFLGLFEKPSGLDFE